MKEKEKGEDRKWERKIGEEKKEMGKEEKRRDAWHLPHKILDPPLLERILFIILFRLQDTTWLFRVVRMSLVSYLACLLVYFAYFFITSMLRSHVI